MRLVQSERVYNAGHVMIEHGDMDDVTKTKKNPWLYYKTNRKKYSCLRTVIRAFVAVSIGKMPENIWLRLVFLLGIFPAEITSFMFLSQHKDTQTTFYLLNIHRHSCAQQNFSSPSHHACEIPRKSRSLPSHRAWRGGRGNKTQLVSN